MTEYIPLIGWIGGLLMAFCAAPEVYKTLKEGKCTVGWGLLGMWGIGEICLLTFEFAHTPTLQRTMNYLLNIVFISILVYYKRKK